MVQENLKQQKNEFLNKLVKLQRPLMTGLLVAVLVLLVYSFLFMTPFYDMYILDGRFLNSNLEKWGIDYTTLPEGSYLYKGDTGRVIGISVTYFTRFTREGYLQSFNHLLFTFAIIGILLVGALFIYRSQLRKRYYKTNFVVLGINVGYLVAISGVILFNLIKWHLHMQTVNFEIINYYYCDLYILPEYTEIFSASGCNWIFILGYVVVGLILTLSVLTTVFTLIKAKAQREAGPIDTSGVIINE